MAIVNRSNFQGHPFHLVSPSPWPLFTSLSLFCVTTTAVSTFHLFENGGYFLALSLITLIGSMSLWFRDIIAEGTYIGNHTLAVQKGLNMGVALFIVSEALFFLAIFWAFFHSALSPTVELGAMWPPMGIEAINPFELPLLNTVILLSSGVCLIWKRFYKFGFLMVLMVLLNILNIDLYILSICFKIIKNYYVKYTFYLVFIFNFILCYLNDWKLSKNIVFKYIQVFSFFTITLLCVSLIYDNIISTNIIFNVGDMNNEIGTKINNEVNLQGHIDVNDKEAGKAIATQVGISSAMVGGALGMSKAMAKSPILPLQKAGAIVGVGVALGLAQVGVSTFNNTIAKNMDTTPTSTATSAISNAKSSTSSTISKFIDDSHSSPLQDIFLSLEIMDYVCLSMIYLLIIQLIYKLYMKDSIKLTFFKWLGNSFNNKIEFYLNKIVKLNKQMSIFWIWFVISIILFGVSVSIYLLEGVSMNIGIFIDSHYNSVDDIGITTYKSIQDALFNLKIVNYLSLTIIFTLSIALYRVFSYNKKINTIYIWLLIVTLLGMLVYSAYIFNELYSNLDSYVNIYNISANDNDNNYNLDKLRKASLFPVLPFSSSRILSTKRIGPHNYEILCILTGSLLGDGSMEKDGNGSRFCFYQKGEHIEYVLWLHKKLLKQGYCNENIPQIKSRMVYDKLAYYCRFRSFTYSSFNWIYEGFYKNGKKSIPSWIIHFLSPIALAIWIMDDGAWIKDRGIKLCTNCFKLSDVQYLVSILKNKYKLTLAIHSAGALNQYNIYIPKSNLPVLIPLVSPHLHPYFLYKLNMVKPNLS